MCDVTSRIVERPKNMFSRRRYFPFNFHLLSLMGLFHQHATSFAFKPKKAPQKEKTLLLNVFVGRRCESSLRCAPNSNERE